MTYTKHTWQTGEVITAAKLNNIEDGIEGGGGDSSSGTFPIKLEYDQETAPLPKNVNNITSDDVLNAMLDGKFPFMFMNWRQDGVQMASIYTIAQMDYQEGKLYRIQFRALNSDSIFQTMELAGSEINI